MASDVFVDALKALKTYLTSPSVNVSESDCDQDMLLEAMLCVLGCNFAGAESRGNKSYRAYAEEQLRAKRKEIKALYATHMNQPAPALNAIFPPFSE